MCGVAAQELLTSANAVANANFHSLTARPCLHDIEKYNWATSSQRHPTFMGRDESGVIYQFSHRKILKELGWRDMLIYKSQGVRRSPVPLGLCGR